MQDEPSLGRTYVFVRSRGGGVFEHTEFTRYEDSAGFLADRTYYVFEHHPDVWRQALAKLRQLGFVELEEARAKGLIPSSWRPTAETSCFEACRGEISGAERE